MKYVIGRAKPEAIRRKRCSNWIASAFGFAMTAKYNLLKTKNYIDQFSHATTK
jgi:hypothetical protein